MNEKQPGESDFKDGNQHPTLNRAARTGRRTEDEQLFLSGGQPGQFLDSDPWRVLRIQSEFVEGFDALANLGPAITLFGSARTEPGHPEYTQAMEVARRLGQAGFTIITGGGPGIMQAGNQGAREANVRSIGLNIELPFEQKINPYVDLSIDFRYFFVRKTMLVKYALGFVIFPGGFGTIDELFEALTLIQTGKIHNFPLVLFGTQYWSGLINWLRETMLREGKIAEEDLNLFTVTDSIDEAIDVIVHCLHERDWRQRQEQSAFSVTRRIYGNPPS
jgi:uncharacterized protein (TIGR00730 family)